MALKKLCSKCNSIMIQKLDTYRCVKCIEDNTDKKESYKYYNKNIRDSKSQSFYNSKEWKYIRKSVLSRDLGLCLVCRKSGIITTSSLVHHIIEVKEDITKALDPTNLITVCDRCHSRIHSDYKKNKATRQKELSKLINVLDY